MTDTLYQCHFCKEWFTNEQVKEIKLEVSPSMLSCNEVYACTNCLKTTKIGRLVAKARQALDSGWFNEIELTEGDLKVRLVRLSPAPYSVTSFPQYP